MSMYDLIEYSKNYRNTTGSLWNYYKHEWTGDRNNNNFPNKNVINSKSFKYKTSVTGSVYNVDENITNAESNEIDSPAYDAKNSANKYFEIVAPLKHLSTFWRSLDMSLINCEVSLTLTWSESCVLTDITTQSARAAQGDNPARPAINAPTNATWETQNCIYQLLLYQLKMIKNSRNN